MKIFQPLALTLLSLLLSCGHSPERVMAQLTIAEQEKYRENSKMSSYCFDVPVRPFDSMVFDIIGKYDRYHQIESPLVSESITIYMAEKGKFTVAQCVYFRICDFLKEVESQPKFLMEIPSDLALAKADIFKRLKEAGENNWGDSAPKKVRIGTLLSVNTLETPEKKIELAWSLLYNSRPQNNNPFWATFHERFPDAKRDLATIIKAGNNEYKINIIVDGIRNMVEPIRMEIEYIVSLDSKRVYPQKGPDVKFYRDYGI